MTTINKSKVTIINRSLTSIFLVICFLLSLIQSQEAYAEMKKVSGTSKTIACLARTRPEIAVADCHFWVSLDVYHSVLSSADPDWNNARFFYVLDAVRPIERDDRGFGVITHPGGDQTFIKFVGRLISVTGGSEMTGESEGFFIGGTGKFKDIKARWLLKWKWTVTEGTMGEWEVEYF